MNCEIELLVKELKMIHSEWEYYYQNKESTIWIIDLRKYFAKADKYWFLLDEKEQAYSAKRNKRKCEYILQKAICKKLLSQFLEMDVKNIHFEKDKMGKPYVVNIDVEINYSHSAFYFMIGVSREGKIGVDIQIPKKLKYDYPLMIFTEEEMKYYKQLEGKSDKDDFFWMVWTAKEAFTKATGTGMTVNFNEIAMFSNGKLNESVEYLSNRRIEKIKIQANKNINYYFTSVFLV